MLMEYHIIYIIVSVILFILIGHYLFVDTKEYQNSEKNMEKEIGNWKMALLLIMINFIFITIVSLGYFQIDIWYTGGFNSTDGSYNLSFFPLYGQFYYGTVWFALVFINLLLMIRAASDALQESVMTKGELPR